jgi:DNA-binding transcriptional ArsR family regulator
MFRVRLSELPMPTGSKDPDVLLAWLLDSMGMVRRKTEGTSVEDEQGALHRLLRETVLIDPLRGWDARALGDSSGLSQTGVHHQLVKLRESGLLAADTEGRWHIQTPLV